MGNLFDAGSEEVEELFEKLLKEQKEDIMFIEKQMKLFEALTMKRQELIKVVMESHPSSIRDLANKLNRDVKNVFNDVKLLNSLKIISLEREGCSVRPTVNKKIIIIRLGR